MAHTERRRTVTWLIAVRVLISTVLLGSATVARIATPGVFAVDPFFVLAGLTYALTIAAAMSLPFVDTHRWLVDLQLAADAVLVSAFIYLTGGITSYFSTLYVLPIMAAATMRCRRGGLMVATLSAVLYTGLVVGQYMNGARILPLLSVAQYTVSLNLFGFFAVAVLSGSLANRLRSAGTRLAQASTTIADLQALNQHVIDRLPSGLATTGANQEVVTFNRAAEAITGIACHEAIGMPIAWVLQLPPEVMTSLEDDTRVVPRRFEVRYHSPDGRGELEIGLSATHLDTPGGRLGWLFTFQDVTAIKKMEREAAIQQRLAAVGEMAAGIAHEIRNPLASMSGSIQVLRHELPLGPEQERLMDIVLRESERLNRTIGSFLAYARPQRFQIARIDLRRPLNDTALLLGHGTEVRGTHQIDVDVPAQELWYDADEGQIRQIVWNLATNGLRAMPKGGRLRLAGALDGASGAMVLTVSDNGIGISNDELDGLFQPFHGSFAKGSGLGLAIVHRIVTDYHGDVRVHSQPGVGTTIAVHLPMRAAVAA